jgi:hypothetical protein
MLLYLRWQQGAFILLSDDDALNRLVFLYGYHKTGLGDGVSACTLLVYLHLRYRATAY